MKLFIKAGATAILSLLLFSSSAKAQDLRLNLQQTKNTSGWVSQGSTKPKPTSSIVEDVATKLPSNTAFVGFINTKAESWKILSRYQLFDTIQTKVSQFLPANLSAFDYSRDVESWLGEKVAFAFLPKVGSTKASLSSNLIAIVPIKDETRIQSILDIFTKDKKNTTQHDYKGVTIVELKTSTKLFPSQPPKKSIEQQPSSGDNLKSISQTKLTKPTSLMKSETTLAYAMVPGYIILGNSSKPLEQVIDNRETGDNLAKNSQFQQTVDNMENKNTLAGMYQNPAEYIALVNDFIKEPNFPLAPLGKDFMLPDELNQFGSIHSSLAFQPEGLRLQIQTQSAPGKAGQAYSQKLKNAKETKKILNQMPAVTYSTFTGSNINQFWQNFVKVFDTQPELKNGLASTRKMVTSSTGLDLDRDVISWMDGEYSVFLYPTKGGFLNSIFPNANVGLGVAIQTSNRSAAESTLKKLDAFIKKTPNGEMTVTNRSHKGHSITSWDNQGNADQSLLAYSWVDNSTLIITTGFGAITDLVPKPNVALPGTYNFTTATNSFPRQNNGYFYINMGSLLSWIYGFVPPTYKQDKNFQILQQVVGCVYSISATTSTTPNREQVDILMVLAPKR